MKESLRESWATRIGFVLAAVGSAVGLGNVWRFPFQVGEAGGSAFLFVYLVFVLLIGIPAMLVEFSIGRDTKRNPVGALAKYGGGLWKYIGGLFVFIAFVILSYYSVIAGWVIRYFLDSFTGAYTAEPSEYFVSVSSGLDAALFHAVFMLAAVVIVAYGIRRGIEVAVKVMVPAIVVLLVALAVYAFTLEGASEAYAFYLSPDFGEIAANWQSVLPAAAGQAFFTLSLGMGIMITYSSYIEEDRNLGEDTGIIVAFDTGIAFIVGLVVFPILLTVGVLPEEPGPGAIFITLAQTFGEIPLGTLIGVVFFGVFALAALSSAISILEVVVSYAVDERGIGRRKAAFGIGGATFVLGLPVAFESTFIDLYDQLAAEVLLVLGSLLLVVLVGWFAADRALEELSKGTDGIGMLGTFWIWLVRVPVVIVLVVSLYLGVVGYADFLTGEFAEFVFG